MDISVQKAFRWRHKFLAFLNQQKPSALSGVVEAAYFGEDDRSFRRT